MRDNNCIIKRKEEVAKDTIMLELESTYLKKNFKSGQFVNVKCENVFLRRPISICDEAENGIKIIFGIKGKGTSELSKIKEGENLLVIGPLGNGFSLTDKEGAVLIGGGLGVFPMLNLARKLKDSNAVKTGKRPWVVINPLVESYLLQSTEFIGANNVADETLREGAIGRIAGMDVLVSTNLTDIDNKYYILAGTNDAITFASQLAKIESLRDKDSFSDLVRGLYLYGAKTVQPKALAKMVVTA